jgi:hypothetical protein
MAQFTVRVELREIGYNKPSGDDYAELHLAMQRQSYFRVIKSDAGHWYHLPTAEYTVSWEATKSDVCNEVKQIASTVWNKFSVLVTESDGRQWYGLEGATQAEVADLTTPNV